MLRVVPDLDACIAGLEIRHDGLRKVSINVPKTEAGCSVVVTIDGVAYAHIYNVIAVLCTACDKCIEALDFAFR